MHLIIICANWPSSLRATSWMRALSGLPPASASGSQEFSVPMGMLAMSGHLELRAQGAGLLQGFQDRDQVAGRSATASFTARTISSSEVPPSNLNMRLPSWLTDTLDCGVTTVWPPREIRSAG